MFRIFKQYIPASFFLLAAVEFLVLIFAVYAGIALRFLGDSALVNGGSRIWIIAVTFALVFFLALAAMGLYQRRFRHGTVGMVLRLAAAMVLGSIAISVLYYLLPAIFVGRGATAFSVLIAFVLILLIRYIFIRTIDQDTLKRRVLVLGAGHQAQQISQQLRRRTDRRGFLVVGYVHVRGEHDVVDENLIL
ncbi:MAG: sugar transferase, partial [Gammaproteobacteria bacterium]|nr:sugar transferase [Gammaproteobacteria bacterium]